LVLSAVGVQAEADLAFSSIHQLLHPVLSGPLARGEELAQLDALPAAPHRLERMPNPQRDSLCTPFGLSDGKAPARLLVALAVLSLLSDVGEERPVVCLVDDAQWLDRAS